MRITFIRPNLGDFRGTDAMEPMVFALLASRTPPEVALEFYDERLAPVPLKRDTDLLAMTVETYTARRAYQIAAHYRRRGVPVVMGGWTSTLSTASGPIAAFSAASATPPSRSCNTGAAAGFPATFARSTPSTGAG